MCCPYFLHVLCALRILLSILFLTMNAASHFGLLHEILVLDAHLKHPLEATNPKPLVRELVDTLLTTLRMEERGELQISPATDLRAPGWSFIQPITTSHISGHYFEKPGRRPNIHMDIYSCCSVNWMKSIEIIHEYLNLADWRATFIDRQIEPDIPRHMLEIAGEGSRIFSEATLQAQALLTRVAAAKKKETVG